MKAAAAGRCLTRLIGKPSFTDGVNYDDHDNDDNDDDDNGDDDKEGDGNAAAAA